MCNFQRYFRDISVKIGIFSHKEVILRPTTSGYIDFRCNWHLRTRLKSNCRPFTTLEKCTRKCPNVQFSNRNNSNSAKNRRKSIHESSLKSSDYAYCDGVIGFSIFRMFSSKKFVVRKYWNFLIGQWLKIKNLIFFMKKSAKITFLLQFRIKLLTTNPGSLHWLS